MGKRKGCRRKAVRIICSSALISHDVNRKLNSEAVSYPLTTAEVISLTNSALASNDRDTIIGLAAELDALNNLGCPLS